MEINAMQFVFKIFIFSLVPSTTKTAMSWVVSHAMLLSLKARHNIINVPTRLFSCKSGITRKSSQVEDYKYMFLPSQNARVQDQAHAIRASSSASS